MGPAPAAGFLPAAFSVVAVPAWFVWERTTGYEWYAAAMAAVAEAKPGPGYRRISRQETRPAIKTKTSKQEIT